MASNKPLIKDKVVFADFDGSIVEFRHPEMGDLNPGSIETLLWLKEKGYQILLNTYRADLQDGTLEKAIKFCKEKGLVFDGVMGEKINPLPFQPQFESHTLFLDDIAVFTPLMQDSNGWSKKINWEELRKVLEKHIE